MNTSIPSHTDLVIIGGGINGAGLCALASKAGLSTVLFEKGDFAEGTSSRSTKLIHGGIRYLEQGRLPLVFESLRERRRLLEKAPHLVRPLSFLLPVYRGDQRPAWKLKIGLWLYDLLAGPRNMGLHQWFPPAKALQVAQALNGKDLVGCGLYFDAQVNDARLVLENILAAKATGAGCFNYCAVTKVEKLGKGFQVHYKKEGASYEGQLQASFLVNATGPWANRTGDLILREPKKWVRPTRGTHIVVPQVLSDQAILVQTQEDRRVLFILPWRGCTLVGTTDLEDTGNPDTLRPSEEEIRYLLKEASRALPGKDWDRKKVISAFCGLRPLAWSEGRQASTLSREDKIVLEGRVLTIVGGKLTTYQAMARKAMGAILKGLGRSPRLPSFPSLPGAPQGPWDEFLNEKVPGWKTPKLANPTLPVHLALLYGSRGDQILDLLRSDHKLGERLHHGGKDIGAQVTYAVREEMAVHLSDVMLRRLELGFGPHRWGPASESASRIMARELEWSEEARKEELEKYRGDLFPAPDHDTHP